MKTEEQLEYALEVFTSSERNKYYLYHCHDISSLFTHSPHCKMAECWGAVLIVEPLDKKALVQYIKESIEYQQQN